MTGPAEPQRPVPPRASGAMGDGPPDGPSHTRGLAPDEGRQLEASVRVVGRAGRGPVVVGVLVAAAFVLGLVRPWDLLTPAVPPLAGRDTTTAGAPDARAVAPGMTARPGTASDGAGEPGRTQPPQPATALTCAYPHEWRTATIEDWSGRPARVWRATDVVDASGPDDPAIPFEPIVAMTVTAIGWCAPIDGPDRPPVRVTASLFRVRDGVAQPIAYDRLEPAAPDALGELWTPEALGVGNRPPWQLGRYVIELRSPGGTYLRYLGLELLDRVERPSPAAPASPPVPRASLDTAAPDVASEPAERP